MVQRIYNYSGTPGINPAPVVPPPVAEAPTPAPAVGDPFAAQRAANDARTWWKQRGGNELYDIFQKITAQNPLAGRAFWQSVLGMGHGENDLQAQTIHKMFGGDINAYNNWRNAAHHGGWEASEGNFDLVNGKWTAGPGYNQQYIKEKAGFDATGDWTANWNWGDYKKNLGVGLQSLPGHAYDGVESWQTYTANPNFTPTGVRYGAQYGGVPVPKQPARPGGTSIPTPTGVPTGGPTSAPPPAVTAPPPTTTTAPSTPVNPYPNTPVNPHGVKGTWSYRPQ